MSWCHFLTCFFASPFLDFSRIENEYVIIRTSPETKVKGETSMIDGPTDASMVFLPIDCCTGLSMVAGAIDTIMMDWTRDYLIFNRKTYFK